MQATARLKGYHASKGMQSLAFPIYIWDKHHLPCHPTQVVCITLFGSCCSHSQGSSCVLAADDTTKSKVCGKLWRTRHNQFSAGVLSHNLKPSRASGWEVFPSSCGPGEIAPQHSGFHPTAMPSSRDQKTTCAHRASLAKSMGNE